MTDSLPSSEEVEAIAKARDIIAERMLACRPTLVEYLDQQAKSEAKSNREWESAFPGCEMGAYRAGSSNAYLDILRRLERNQFSSPNKE